MAAALEAVGVSSDTGIVASAASMDEIFGGEIEAIDRCDGMIAKSKNSNDFRRAMKFGVSNSTSGTVSRGS